MWGDGLDRFEVRMHQPNVPSPVSLKHAPVGMSSSSQILKQNPVPAFGRAASPYGWRLHRIWQESGSGRPTPASRTQKAPEKKQAPPRAITAPEPTVAGIVHVTCVVYGSGSAGMLWQEGEFGSIPVTIAMLGCGVGVWH